MSDFFAGLPIVKAPAFSVDSERLRVRVWEQHDGAWSGEALGVNGNVITLEAVVRGVESRAAAFDALDAELDSWRRQQWPFVLHGRTEKGGKPKALTNADWLKSVQPKPVVPVVPAEKSK